MQLLKAKIVDGLDIEVKIDGGKIIIELDGDIKKGLDYLKKLIPGSIDDAIIGVGEAALLPIADVASSEAPESVPPVA